MYLGKIFLSSAPSSLLIMAAFFSSSVSSAMATYMSVATLLPFLQSGLCSSEDTILFANRWKPTSPFLDLQFYYWLYKGVYT